MTTATGATDDTTQLDVLDVERIALPGGPDWLGVDDSFLYVKLDSGVVHRIDPASGAVVATVDMGHSDLCQGIGVGFDSAWICDGSDVLRVDFDPGEIVARISAGKTAGQGHLATGFDRVWVLQGDGSVLAGIDPESNSVGDPVALPMRGTGVAVGADALWVISALDDSVLAIDPAGGAVMHRIDDLDAPSAISIRDGVVWIGGSGSLYRIDEASGALLSTVEGGIGRSGAVAADQLGAWVRSGNEVRHLAADSLTLTEPLVLGLDGPSRGDMLVAFGALWTSASEHATLFRIALE